MSDQVPVPPGITYEQKIRNARASGRMTDEDNEFLNVCEQSLKDVKRLPSNRHVNRLHDLWIKAIAD